MWEKQQVCLHSLALCAYEIGHRTGIFSTNLHLTTKSLRDSSNPLKMFEVQTLSNWNSNFVTSLEGQAAMKRTDQYPPMPKAMEWIVVNASRCYGTGPYALMLPYHISIITLVVKIKQQQ